MDKRLSSHQLRNVYDYLRAKNDTYIKTKAVKQRVERIGGGYQGTKEEFNKVVEYWKPYGIKPARVWYDLYCDGMDAYDPRFVPDPVWFNYIVPYFNKMRFAAAYTDKAVYTRTITGVEKPETIIKNLAGYYYAGEVDSPITREEAERICEQEEHLIFKPSIAGKGNGILFYDRGEPSSKSVPEILDAMKTCFVVQRIVKQHPDLARLNQSTLNSVRVMTFRFKGEVHVLSAQLRIGRAGSRVDNISAGGSACAIKPDGWLHEKSVTRKSTWTDETENGIKLKDICVPSFEAITETAKRLHCQLPYFDIVGWDFAVREDGTPVFIEYNLKPDQNQIGCRAPAFGDMSKEVFDEVFINKTLQKLREK